MIENFPICRGGNFSPTYEYHNLMTIHEFLSSNSHFLARDRWIFFRQRGTTCVICDLEATHVVFWKQPKATNNPRDIHVDAAALTENGFVMITLDHIFPRSKGGTKHFSNLQPMCAPCNHKKGDKVPNEIPHH